MSSIWLLIFLAVTMRIFVFEIKFVKIRQWAMNKSKLWNIFLNCPFCNGFWTGLFMVGLSHYKYFTEINSVGDLLYKLAFLFCLGVSVGSVSYLIHNFYEILEKDDSFDI